ncbi:MAG TPA: glycosyltransferase [Polyangia bacterium]|nr:glycosyltransferase [Polyangia bacterium]
MQTTGGVARDPRARYTRDGIDGILEPRMTSSGAPRSILFIIDELEVGGSQRQILVLARALLQAGHKVTVAYFRGESAAFRPTLEAAGVAVELVAKRAGVDPLFLYRLGRFLAADPHRLVLTFGYTASLWARLVGWPAGASRSISCIRNLTYLPDVPGAALPAVKGLERVLARQSRWIVANSRLTVDSLVARGIVARKKALVIPNAVEEAAIVPRERARARLREIVGGGAGADGPEHPIVGTLARLVDVKDLPTLLRAARIVIDAVPGARFVIGGEGPRRAALEALRSELHLGAHVHLPGTLEGHDVIAGLDAAVLTSTSEGMPNFVLESMAASVPVVSTRAGAAPELLDEGALGRLATAGDVRGIAEGILDVLRAPDEARARAARAAQKLRDMTPARIAQRYLDLFE